MIDVYLLEKLVAFAQEGTLAKAAEKLNTTQPSVSRALQKLEKQLGVPLFERTVNKMQLNEIGQFMVEHAKDILIRHQQLQQDVIEFAKNKAYIRIASVAPGPLLRLMPLSHIQHNKLVAIDEVEHLLETHVYDVIITTNPSYQAPFKSVALGSEQLFVHVDLFMPIAMQESVYFKELHDMSFIVLQDIGIWKTIISNNIPNAKFLYQQEFESFSEITRYANFPFFSTNLSATAIHHKTQTSRKRLKIKDACANVSFYATFLREKEMIVKSVIKDFQKNWTSE